MNEKEAIENLKELTNCFKHDLLHEDRVAVSKVIEWLQKRADIIELANNPPNTWDRTEMPFLYEMGKFLQREAHYSLDMSIVYENMEHCVDKAVRDAKLAASYLRESSKDGKK